ncbi:MAG: FG-GAP repeat protein, partial [Planctomycetota bacterium]
MLATALAASLPFVFPAPALSAPHDPPGQRPSSTLSFSSSSDLFVVTSSDITSSDHFGRSLDVDGSIALVGSRYAAHSGVILSGAAYVFEQHGLNWVETHKLIPPDPADQDLFGHDVAVSGDTLLISARNDDLGAVVDAGSAYVFVKDGADWTLQAHLMAPDADAFDAFGISVDIDGDRAVVGAALNDEFGQEDVGAAYVFSREAGVWTFEAKLMASDGADGDTFGRGVAVWGETIAVGAPRHDSLGLERAGAVYVFDRLDGAWSESAKLVAPDAMPGDDLGDALVLEGDTLLVGASLDDHQGQLDVGSVGVFVRADGTWMPQAKLLASDGIAGDQFGHYMALDGDRAAVGASQARVGLVEQAGSAYQFERVGGQWTE